LSKIFNKIAPPVMIQVVVDLHEMAEDPAVATARILRLIADRVEVGDSLYGEIRTSVGVVAKYVIHTAEEE
jgi:hypothetical protein